ncbi:Cytochrome P450 [Muriicola jejuensis]|uniref:Cytochrome P450 n=1 Tax=Muriicola jejuensis TaxID=504488 RepID=A0A6P0UAJ1_9FLAO|nr:cytochrome P450 [Muriicola jejuensis]NER09510.1 cytochrome P450 [Muriicola jejuensis]SMP08033.1 Cytochrome P450 [Muriicola jejuensis]
MADLATVSLLEVLKNRKRILANPLPFHSENFERYGDTFRVKVGPGKPVVFTRDPEIIQQVLQKQQKKFSKSPLQTKDLAKYIGNGLLTAEGEHWRVQRRMIQPAFHKKKLEGLLATMRKAIREELERILPGREQDVFPLMGDLAFQVVAKSLFSNSDIRERMRELQHITETNQKMLIREMRQPYLVWWFKLSGRIKKHLAYSERGREILNALIEERVTQQREEDDLLDMLLRATYEDGTHMERRQLIDEVLILFTAGHETTANALSFTLFLLATHPEIQEKVYQEVMESKRENENTLEGIARFQYTQQCIEEAMRLYPPVYVIDRMATEAVELSGHRFPEGALLLMSVYELHRYRSFWKNPELFMPERFSRERKKEMGAYYYPFGAGPRMCIGNNFAMYEMIMTVAEIIGNYRLSSVKKNVELVPLISLKPKSVRINMLHR